MLGAFFWVSLAVQSLAAPRAVEIVLCRCKEDVSWVVELGFDDLATVYSKCGQASTLHTMESDNFGREGGTFLQHIVDRYDTLPDWTVFSQAGKPSNGYFGHRQGGGHMMKDVTFADYVTAAVQRVEEPRFFVFTGAVMLHENSIFQSLRAGYSNPVTSNGGTSGSRCGDEYDFHQWMEFPAWFRFMVQSLQVAQKSPVMGLHQQDLFRLFDISPVADIVMFAQGARFAASRQAIQSRPKQYYANLLSYMHHEDPWAGYFLEFFWWYVIGGSSAPCGFETALASTAQTTISKPRSRFLSQQVSGQQVSGISGSAIIVVTVADILAMTDAQRKAFFVDVATTSGIIAVDNGFQYVLIVPVAGSFFTVTNAQTTDNAGQKVSLTLVPCASTSNPSDCTEAAAIWTQCPMRQANIAALFSNGLKCGVNPFVGCSIIRFNKDGSILSESKFTALIQPCPLQANSASSDNSYCLGGSVGDKKSDGSCFCQYQKTSVIMGQTNTNTSSGSNGSNTGLFYIIFVLMIIPIALLVAGLLYYYCYHYKPAREAEQYLAPCCQPGYAYPAPLPMNTPSYPVSYI